jgi:uncharacterized protein
MPPSTPAPAGKDPLWFLGNQGDAMPGTPPEAAGDGQPSSGATAAVRAEVVLGPLPPFFGSSAEVPKVEAVPVLHVSTDTSGSPAAPSPSTPVARAFDGEVPRFATVDSTPRSPSGPGATPRDGLSNGEVHPRLGPATADSRSTQANGEGQVRGLEAMVAELLRPMLRHWLDENMPRLVSAALKAEAELISKRDPKKT